MTAPEILASSDVLEVSVPASGGTDAGTFKADRPRRRGRRGVAVAGRVDGDIRLRLWRGLTPGVSFLLRSPAGVRRIEADSRLLLECLLVTADAENAPTWTPGDEFESRR